MSVNVNPGNTTSAPSDRPFAPVTSLMVAPVRRPHNAAALTDPDIGGAAGPSAGRMAVTLTREPCPCGRPYARLLAVDGRSDDVLRMPALYAGTIDVVAGQLLGALDDVPGLRRSR